MKYELDTALKNVEAYKHHTKRVSAYLFYFELIFDSSSLYHPHTISSDIHNIMCTKIA